MLTKEENEAIETLQYLCSDDCISKDIIKTIVKLIEKLQKENEELRVQDSIIYLDYKILKDKIREKIEELDKLEKNFDFEELTKECEYKKEVLEELLEEEE